MAHVLPDAEALLRTAIRALSLFFGAAGVVGLWGSWAAGSPFLLLQAVICLGIALAIIVAMPK